MADDHDDDTPARSVDGSDDSSSNSGSDSEEEQIEWLVTSRAKRATAGNRLTSLLQQEEADDELELLFAEADDDAGFEDDVDADSDVQMDSSSDEEDQGPVAGADDLEGERELRRQEKQQAKKRKVNDGIPKIFKKKVKIDPTIPARATSGPAPRPKKKSERASWIPTAEDAPTRASARGTTRQSKQQLHAQMIDREVKRLRQLANMEKAAAAKEAAKKPALTQADRIAEAARVEKSNSKSLSRWEEAEQQREEEQRAKLAALSNRQLEGPVITWWSGVGEWTGGILKKVGKTLRLEEPKEKSSKKRKHSEMDAEVEPKAAAEKTSGTPDGAVGTTKEASAKEDENKKPSDTAAPSATRTDASTQQPTSSADPTKKVDAVDNPESSSKPEQESVPGSSDKPELPVTSKPESNSEPAGNPEPNGRPEGEDKTESPAQSQPDGKPTPESIPESESKSEQPSQPEPPKAEDATMSEPPSQPEPSKAEDVNMSEPTSQPEPSKPEDVNMSEQTTTPLPAPPQAPPAPPASAPSHPPFILAPPPGFPPAPAMLDGSTPLPGLGFTPTIPPAMPPQAQVKALSSIPPNQLNQQQQPPPEAPTAPPITEYGTVNNLILTNFEETAIKSKDVQTQILFNRKFPKAPSKFPFPSTLFHSPFPLSSFPTLLSPRTPQTNHLRRAQTRRHPLLHNLLPGQVPRPLHGPPVLQRLRVPRDPAAQARGVPVEQARGRVRGAGHVRCEGSAKSVCCRGREGKGKRKRKRKGSS